MSANQTSLADTGDFESMRAYQPHDATTNPSLIFAATQKSEYSLLLDKAIVDLTSKNYPYDDLILAAGARHSYFGNDHWEAFAPGLKTLSDAVELRRRIVDAFEIAETTTDPELKKAALTFVVIGAGPTGVEIAG